MFLALPIFFCAIMLAENESYKGADHYSYTYNHAGIRTSKNVNGITTTYKVNEKNQVVEQSDGTNSIKFAYDSQDQPVYMEYQGKTYYYEKNLQGDIIGLFDDGKNSVVQYQYDSWGKLLNTTGTLASTVGTINPLRYRGYYYDVETGFFYVGSRYYDPNTCRFLNADEPSMLGLSTVSPIGANLYTYCLNNPVNMIDKDGHFGTPISWAMAAVLGVVGGVIGYFIAKRQHWNWWKTGLFVAACAAGGAVAGFIAGEVLAVSINAFLVAYPQYVISLSPTVLKLIGYYNVLSKEVNFTKTCIERMSNVARYVPINTLINCIKYGKAKADPQGTKAIMYTIDMWKNGKLYKLEVLYDRATNTMLHFLYK